MLLLRALQPFNQNAANQTVNALYKKPFYKNVSKINVNFSCNMYNILLNNIILWRFKANVHFSNERCKPISEDKLILILKTHYNNQQPLMSYLKNNKVNVVSFGCFFVNNIIIFYFIPIIIIINSSSPPWQKCNINTHTQYNKLYYLLCER